MSRAERIERIEAMKREIERRGATVHIDYRLPLELTERFLEDVLACPQCRRSSEKAGH
jgi:hypothetical protein